MPERPAQPFRQAAGGRVDRDAPIEFFFDGRRYEGFRGDTLASALLANGRHLIGRSIKYHRPRGIVAAGVEEPNGIVQIGRGPSATPHCRVTQIELFDGLWAESAKGWPSLRFDLGAVADRMGGLLSAGFFYKTFMWPRAGWSIYEHLIRRAAGLGRAPQGPDPDVYDHRFAHCDVLVVGAGPSGLAAALTAGRSGARVMLLDERPEPGGSLLDGHYEIDGAPAQDWVAAARAELGRYPEVRVLSRTTGFGYYDHNLVAALERRTDHLAPHLRAGPRERLWLVRARQVILATGAIERPLLFGNNDRPGVMLASAVSAYLHRFAVLAGRRVLFFTNNDSVYEPAAALAAAGAAVTVVDARPASQTPSLPAEHGVEKRSGQVVVEALGTQRVRGARLGAGADGARAGAATEVLCDLIAVSGGWSPAVHLYAQSGGRARFSETLQAPVPGAPVAGQRCAGAAAGSLGLADCLREGGEAGGGGARACGWPDPRPDPTRRQPVAGPHGRHSPALPLAHDWCPNGRPTRGEAKVFVDLQNDTTVADIALAAREGLESIEHVKRYTALGFGTDQGKLGNVTGAAVLSGRLGRSPAEVGTTTFRPPYVPVSFGAAAGQAVEALYDPVRKTALHAWHEEHGAVFEPVGQWLRPRYYPRTGEDMASAVGRECLATRTRVGILDASTLGKIDVQGTDAAAFLERVYTNGWTGLSVGRCRYGLMLGEDGMVMDDGVTTRLGPARFLMTTTTGGAGPVLEWLERWLQTEWPELDVFLTSVTDQWATISLGGPNSRAVLSALCSDIDLSAAAFPFMSSREGTVGSCAARVARISFHGELGYEINVAASEARHLWEALLEAGSAHGITPYGTETMHVLRAEKGYIIVGQDTDGSVTPIDLGLERMCSRSKDFIGKRSLARSDCARADRKQLVGLLSADRQTVLPEGAALVREPFTRLPVPMIGHVTSSYHSPTLARPIALALVEGGRDRHGEAIFAALADGRLVPAQIVEPTFYDTEGARSHG